MISSNQTLVREEQTFHISITFPWSEMSVLCTATVLPRATIYLLHRRQLVPLRIPQICQIEGDDGMWLGTAISVCENACEVNASAEGECSVWQDVNV